MTRKAPPKPKPDDPAEYARFLETAKKVEASEDPKDFERAFKRVIRRPSRQE
jgi:hypothetical protein